MKTPACAAFDASHSATEFIPLRGESKKQYTISLVYWLTAYEMV